MPKLLSDHFEKIAFKRLSAVEADKARSNQHEFNSLSGMKAMFGTGAVNFEAVQIYLDDSREVPIYAKSTLKWYDSREKNPLRSAEYRIYYKDTEVTEQIQPGDLMIIARRTNGEYLNIFAKGDSSAENQLRILFGISEAAEKAMTQEVVGGNNKQIDLVRDFILEKLGIIEEGEERDEVTGYLEEMLRLFPDGLPTTKEFSAFARSTLNTDSDPDTKLMEWWSRETQLFKIYERHLFDSTKRDLSNIDDFIAFSLSLHNTRKSRAGSALENHIEQLFIDRGIRYSRTQVTENNSKPDFIFPHIDDYRNPDFPEEELHMLAVKTSCKDRWRQVLPEAARISHKHLLTLEPGISKNQTDEMRSHNLTLVLPADMHSSYAEDQRDELLTVQDFISLVSI